MVYVSSNAVLSDSVGEGGKNKRSDVILVQEILNRRRINADPVDGICGKKTIKAIRDYQRLFLSNPDGLIVPKGTTWKKLIKLKNSEADIHLLNSRTNRGVYPLPFKVTSYLSGQGSYGYSRKGTTRRHAGCDLYGSVGTPVYAIMRGNVVGKRSFQNGIVESMQIMIEHDKFTARYCEIKVVDSLRIGHNVSQGQIIGHIANRGTDNKPMLHFEIFDGYVEDSFTINDYAIYERRIDLINPTDFLESLPLK